MKIDGTSIPTQFMSVEDSQLRHTRKILTIFLGICLGLSILGLCLEGFGSNIELRNADGRRGEFIGSAIGQICFYAFGLFVARRYSGTGLRVFAWIEIIRTGLVIILIITFAAILIVAANIIQSNNGQDIFARSSTTFLTTLPVVILMFLLLICIADLILAIIIIKLSFKLAHLIDFNKRLPIEQI